MPSKKASQVLQFLRLVYGSIGTLNPQKLDEFARRCDLSIKVADHLVKVSPLIKITSVGNFNIYTWLPKNPDKSPMIPNIRMATAFLAEMNRLKNLKTENKLEVKQLLLLSGHRKMKTEAHLRLFNFVTNIYNLTQTPIRSAQLKIPQMCKDAGVSSGTASQMIKMNILIKHELPLGTVYVWNKNVACGEKLIWSIIESRNDYNKGKPIRRYPTVVLNNTPDSLNIKVGNESLKNAIIRSVSLTKQTYAWTKYNLEKLLLAYATNTGFRKVAKEMGKSVNACTCKISDMIRKKQIDNAILEMRIAEASKTHALREWSDDEKIEVIQMFIDGHTYDTIAKKLNCTYYSIHNLIRSLESEGLIKNTDISLRLDAISGVSTKSEEKQQPSKEKEVGSVKGVGDAICKTILIELKQMHGPIPHSPSPYRFTMGIPNRPDTVTSQIDATSIQIAAQRFAEKMQQIDPANLDELEFTLTDDEASAIKHGLRKLAVLSLINRYGITETRANEMIDLLLSVKQ